MDRFIKAEFSLTSKECREIVDFFDETISSVFILKEIEVLIKGYIFYLKLIIEDNLLSIHIEDLYKKIDSITIGLISFDDVIGVLNYSCTIEHENRKINGDTFHFFIKINKKYSRSIYKNKTEYYIKTLQDLQWRVYDDDDLVYKEIAYQDFSNKHSIVLASCYLLMNKNSWLEDTEALNLYEEKLNFKGIFLEDYIDKSIPFESESFLDFINKLETKSEVFQVILKYIATIKYEGDKIPSDFKSFSLTIGIELYRKYLNI